MTQTHTMTRTYAQNIFLAAGLLAIAGMLVAPFGAQAATKKVDASCVADAVEVREDALIGAWGDFSSTMETALEVRKAKLVSAWEMSDPKERVKTLKETWKGWREDRKDAHTELRKDRKAAWDAFKKTVKDSCKVTLPKEESLEKDSKGTITV